GERLGEDQVAAHHGSLSKERRQRVESRLRAGHLRALVATASLELGIDIGPVELVCQVGSPRSFATFLQRVGRSNHTRSGTPRGALYPTTRDELVECAALLRGTGAGRLDAIVQPVAPLDIVAQQVVAECAAQEWSEGPLFDLIRHAAPFERLSRQDFDDVVELVSEGITTGRGRRAAYLHRDRVNGRLRAGTRSARTRSARCGRRSVGTSNTKTPMAHVAGSKRNAGSSGRPPIRSSATWGRASRRSASSRRSSGSSSSGSSTRAAVCS